MGRALSAVTGVPRCGHTGTGGGGVDRRQNRSEVTTSQGTPGAARGPQKLERGPGQAVPPPPREPARPWAADSRPPGLRENAPWQSRKWRGPREVRSFVRTSEERERAGGVLFTWGGAGEKPAWAPGPRNPQPHL